METENKSAIEKHLQTFIASAILAVTLWMGSTIVEVQKDVAVLTEALNSTTRQLIEVQTDLKAATGDRFRRKDFDKEKEILTNEDQVLHKRIDDVKGRLRIVEEALLTQKVK